MFNGKKNSLIEKKAASASSNNAFIKAGMKNSAVTTTGNGAKAFTTQSNDFATDFAQVGAYKAPRDYKTVSAIMSILWTINPLMTFKLALYIRLITRKVQLWNGETTKEIQKGTGLRHEGIMRLLWIAINKPNIFWNNIHLVLGAGSWKDIITMLSYDLQYHGWEGRVLNWTEFGQLLLAGLENPNTVQLVKKYLPTIKTNAKCTTLESQADNLIAKWICSLLFGNKQDGTTYKKYRKLKSSGTAHTWQQLISQGKHKLVDFNTIHGRALSLLVSSKYLKNQGLEDKYKEWIAAKPVTKFTGYVYELASKIGYGITGYQKDTINKQYLTLLENAGKINKNFIVVKDTSTSMDYPAYGTNMSSYHVAKSLSIYFANLIKGYFHNHYIDFSSNAILRQIKQDNFVDAWLGEIRQASANTNFLSVAQLFAQIKNSGVSEKEFPEGLVLVSDGEFDNTGMYQDNSIKAFKDILLAAGFSNEYCKNLTFIFWDIRNSFYHRRQGRPFHTYNSEKSNVFYFGGYDGSVISLLLGDKPMPKNQTDLFKSAMDQEILNLVEV